MRAAAVSGQTPARELQRVLFDFGSERIDVLCNADLLTEGWDETRASVVMHLAPDHLRARLRAAPRTRDAPRARTRRPCRSSSCPMGDPMGVQTSHEVFGLGLVQAARPRRGPARERASAASWPKAAALLSEREGDSAKLVNPAAAPGLIAAGLADGGWRKADPGRCCRITLMEEWVEAAAPT